MFFLLGSEYRSNDNCIFLKFYDIDNHKMVFIKDETNHKPYCYVSEKYKTRLDYVLTDNNTYNEEIVEKIDSINDKKINMIKVTGANPLMIGGNADSLREKIVTWESDIKYHERYLYDKGLICGLKYDDKLNPVYEDIDYNEVYSKIGVQQEGKYKEYIDDWVKLLNQPIPELYRMAIDIEVEYDGTKVPTVADPNQRIIAIGCASNRGDRKVLVLDEEGRMQNNEHTYYYKDEKLMLIQAFEFIRRFPIILTFNGDAFDLPYLHARCEKLGISYDDVPLTVKRRHVISNNATYIDPVYISNCIHLDLFRFFKNKSIQNYAFSHVYNEFGLDAISKGVLNESKLEFDFINDKNDLQKMADYCLNDAELTVKLTTFNDNLLIKLMIMICRISKLPIDDVCRYGINQWGRAMFYSDHIKNNILIPRADELLIKGVDSSVNAIIKDKKYKGAFVKEPETGVFFNVDVVDFGCFDYMTEILTHNGWKNIYNIIEGEKCYSLNLNNGQIENDIIRKVYRYDYEGYLNKVITPNNMGFLFTDNHRIVYKKSDKDNVSGYSKDLYVDELQNIKDKKFFIPHFSNWNGDNQNEKFNFGNNEFLDFLDVLLISGYINSKVSKKGNIIKKEYYRGKVWCASTNNTTLIVRRHGNVIITGNSLYPSIIKVNNLSYETVNCLHIECKKNLIPETKNWVCKKNHGLTSLIIGSLKDLRVSYYKYMSKKKELSNEERQLYEIVAQTLKVILNASYGVMGFDSFQLYCLPVAEAVTAFGRNIIKNTIDKAESKEIGIKTLYGDSVLGDTPIVIEEGGIRKIVSIESLFPEDSKSVRVKLKNIKVLSDNGDFTDVNYIYRHKVNKKIYKIITRNGLIECTEDHSLMIDGNEVSPKDLKVGDEINLVNINNIFLNNDETFNEDQSWLLGTFIAEGTCGIYKYKYGNKYSWRIVCLDKNVLIKCQRILKNEFGYNSKIYDLRKSSGVYGLNINGNVKTFVELFKSLCYDNKNRKIIPYQILNSNENNKNAFLNGFIENDGYNDKNGIQTIDQKNKNVISGVCHIFKEFGFDYTLEVRYDKPKIVRIRKIKNKKDIRLIKSNIIKEIKIYNDEIFVYDLGTKNNHFCGGIGNILLHNTDSIFVHNSETKKLNELIRYTKEKYGIDLEKDKHYRYLIMTGLKKNYLGITDEGKLDIKGLVGKKSHTPVFIRSMFFEMLDFLKDVKDEDMYNEAREKIKVMIKEKVTQLNNGEIELDLLSFTPTINKNIKSYGKKISTNNTLEGGKYEEYTALPQHIKAARMIGADVGSKIKFIKTRDKEGVKPTKLVKSIDEVDKEKYIEIIENTFGQILDAIKLNFREVISDNRQTTLDSLFWKN